MDLDLLCDCLQLAQLRTLVARVTEARKDKEAARKIIKQEVGLAL